jgi:hypothetical protein
VLRHKASPSAGLYAVCGHTVGLRSCPPWRVKLSAGKAAFVRLFRTVSALRNGLGREAGSAALLGPIHDGALCSLNSDTYWARDVNLSHSKTTTTTTPFGLRWLRWTTLGTDETGSKDICGYGKAGVAHAAARPFAARQRWPTAAINGRRYGRRWSSSKPSSGPAGRHRARCERVQRRL